MIIVEVKGGLGNQLFQYALSRSLARRGKDVFLDNSAYQLFPEEHRTFELGGFPEAKYKIIDEKTAEEYRGFSYTDSIIKKIKHHIIKKNKLLVEKDVACFDSSIFDADDAYLSGYWQSDKYFSDIMDELALELKFSNNIVGASGPEYMELWQKINRTNSVCVHVRMTDYMSDDLKNTMGCVCNEDYYNRAIRLVKDEIKDPFFYIFSDDIEAAKTKIRELDICKACFVNQEKKWGAFEDLFLMSNCSAHIIANSSFSWWGAKLSNSQMVVCPSVWRKGEDKSDIICGEWHKIDVVMRN